MRTPHGPTCWRCGYSRVGIDPEQNCPECDAEPDNRPDEPLARILTPVAIAFAILGMLLCFTTLLMPGLIVLLIASSLGWRIRHPSSRFRVTHRRNRVALVAERSVWAWPIWFAIMFITGAIWPGIWNWW
ncbi:MAG: hypothetical protein ACI89L_000789 [Phycisphaerales bacterium]|jgi:hypothetical protein